LNAPREGIFARGTQVAGVVCLDFAWVERRRQGDAAARVEARLALRLAWLRRSLLARRFALAFDFAGMGVAVYRTAFFP
jgi:hypothetical protein